MTATLPDNIWYHHHDGDCHECGILSSLLEQPVDAAGYCEYHASLISCATEGCIEIAHVLSEHDAQDERHCSRCELKLAQEYGEDEDVTRWEALVAADYSLHVLTPQGPIPRPIWDRINGKKAA